MGDLPLTFRARRARFSGVLGYGRYIPFAGVLLRLADVIHQDVFGVYSASIGRVLCPLNYLY